MLVPTDWWSCFSCFFPILVTNARLPPLQNHSQLVTTYHGDHAYCFDITASGDVSALFPDPAAALGVGIGAAAPPAAGGVSRLLLVPQRQQSVTPSGRHSGEAGGNGDRRDSGGGSSGGSGRCVFISGWTAFISYALSCYSVICLCFMFDKRVNLNLNVCSASPLCPRAEEAKARGNAAMFERKWTAAVVAFTDALHWAPGAPALYAQRAGACGCGCGSRRGVLTVLVLRNAPLACNGLLNYSIFCAIIMATKPQHMHLVVQYGSILRGLTVWPLFATFPILIVHDVFKIVLAITRICRGAVGTRLGGRRGHGAARLRHRSGPG